LAKALKKGMVIKMSKNTEPNDRKVFKKIHDNYKYLNKMMVEEMEIASEHGGLTGDYREQMWMRLFRSIIPQKFSMAQGVMIIDSEGNVSKEVDIVVYDEQYTPYVFQYNTLKFIPIEAVAVVIECKSTNPNVEKLKEWADTIEQLKPKASGIARIVSGYVCGITNKSQLRTRPIKILATIKTSENEEPLETIKEKLGENFDFIIQEKADRKSKANMFKVLIKNEDKPLGWWGKRLNGAGNEDYLEIERMSDCQLEEKDYKELSFLEKKYLKNNLKDLMVEGNDFLSLNLQLNQLLMLLNNPMLFPHYAYAKQFNKIIKTLPEDEK
jgi:hypothetical protein